MSASRWSSRNWAGPTAPEPDLPSRGWVPPSRSGLSPKAISRASSWPGETFRKRRGPARLLEEAIPLGSAVDVFGYPGSPPRLENGANSRLIARGAVGGGLIQLDADGDTAIRTQAGFSGSPVVVTDEAGDAVIGMSPWRAVTVAPGTLRGAGCRLAKGWPDVLGALSVPPCPYKGLLRIHCR